MPTEDSTYFAIMKETDYPPHIRLRIVQEAKQTTKSETARRWGMSRTTVIKWVARYEQQGYEGLKNLSRAPKSPHRALSEADRKQIVELWHKYKTIGAARLKRMLGLPWAVKTIRKVWHEHGLIRQRRRKHTVKLNLRQVKKQLQLGQLICMDTKDLDDIPELYADLKAHNLPTVQYTARDVTSGMLWIAFAKQRSLQNSAVFAARILHALADSGVPLNEVTIQTDNGSEFIGHVRARADSLFTQLVHTLGATHKTIPPGYKTYQADVETAHDLIEKEFYCLERFRGLPSLLNKANAYQAWFNILRDNSYKEYQTPWQIALAKRTTIKPALALLPPVLLESHPLTRRYFQRPTPKPRRPFDTLLKPHPPDHYVGFHPMTRLGLELIDKRSKG